jgi:myo-inositol-1(or 4)-monophosphatase
MDTNLLKQLTEMALDIAQSTGRLLVEDRPAVMQVETKTSETDVVTAMDKAAEAHIISEIRAQRPDDLFIGEEGSVNNSANPTNVKWIVDPIDGTVNYLHKHPIWSVSIGVQVDDITQVGVVHAPLLGEIYLAVRGQGAFLLNKSGKSKVEISRNTILGHTLVATGFSYESKKRKKHSKVIHEISDKVRDFRRDGSAAIDLCMVGLGRVDAYFETGLHPWDYTAGALFVEEAGGITGGVSGKPLSDDLAIAANPGVFEEFSELIRDCYQKFY